MKPNLMTLFLIVNLKLTDIIFLFLEGIERGGKIVFYKTRPDHKQVKAT